MVSAVTQAWHRGLLSWKLYDHQLPLYNALVAALNDTACVKYVLNCSRRFGKSTVLCLIALEFAIRHPNSQIRFAAPTAKALRKIIRPIFKWLLTDCPDDLMPRWNSQDNAYLFPNGSELHCAGTDNQHYESLRGTTSHLNVIDEAGFCDELDYVVRSVLMPQTLTTGGKTLLASTPPATPAHDFFHIAQECKAQGYYSEFTIYDNKSLTQPIIDLYARESGGYDSSTFKREYLCQFTVDSSLAIVPEWRHDYVRVHDPNPDLLPYYHRYTALDLGVKDLTACLFGYYDFTRATLVIEDECHINGPDLTTPLLATLIIEKEQTLWGAIAPYKRIADNNNLLLLQDLGSLHGLYVQPTNKDSLEAMVNELRILVGEGRLLIHPRCKFLIDNLKYGVFTANRKEFARTQSLGHFDHLAALIYMVRNLDKHTNPVPQTHNTTPFTHWLPTTTSVNHEAVKRMFKRSL